MIDYEAWAIKNVKADTMVMDRFGRSLWIRKPTNSMNTIEWYHRHQDLKLELIRVRVTEIVED
tara:strand:+ start:1092 stop:1280 length:189 start_codon:yes stop_codon:yes gene_type:complete